MVSLHTQVHQKLHEIKAKCDFIQEMAQAESLFMEGPLMVIFCLQNVKLK